MSKEKDNNQGSGPSSGVIPPGSQESDPLFEGMYPQGAKTGLAAITDSTGVMDVTIKMTSERDNYLDGSDIPNLVDEFRTDPRLQSITKTVAEQMLAEAAQIGAQYEKKINKQESVYGGLATEHRIHQGELYITIQEIIKHTTHSWGKWYMSNLFPPSLRTAQQYIRLAKTPNIREYAPLGTEKLNVICGVMDKSGEKYDEKDPVGAFLQQHNLKWDLEAQIEIGEFKVKVESAVEVQRLKNIGIKTIDPQKVEALIRSGKDLSARQRETLRQVEGTKQNPNAILDDILVGNDVPEPTMTSKKQAETFKKSVSRLLSQWREVSETDEWKTEIDIKDIEEIKAAIATMEERLTSSQATTSNAQSADT